MLGSEVEVAPSLDRAIESADVVVITTPWPEIRAVALSAFARPAGKLPVIDPWGLVKGTAIADTARLILLGRRGLGASGSPALAHSGHRF